MKKLLIYLAISVISLYSGYEFSEINHKEQWRLERYNELHDGKKDYLFAHLRNAYLVSTLVSNIEDDNKREFYRLSCAYLNMLLLEIKKIREIKDVKQSLKDEAFRKIIEIEEYVERGKSNNNCKTKPPNN